MTNFLKSTEDLLKGFQQKLKKELPLNFHHLIDNTLNVDCLKKFDTEYKIVKYFTEKRMYIAPKKFFIGEINDDRKEGGKTVYTKKKCFGEYVSVAKTLKSFYELPNVYREVVDYMRKETTRDDGQRLYSSIFQGER